jgi:putative transposase
MEDLAVQKLEQNNSTNMSRVIGDVGWRMMRTFMTYKCENKGKNLIIIGRFDPSSKTCSNCGNIYQELRREEKSWICKDCGKEHDRDINAAKNIKDFGIIKSLGKGFSERSAS